LVSSAALAALVLLGVAAPGAWAAAAEITAPANDTTFKEHKGDEIKPVVIEGTELHVVEVTPELPEGLHLRPSAVSPATKWEIYGTPAKEEKEQPDDTTKITAKNEAGEPSVGGPEIFWSIVEPLPEFLEPFPGPQTSTAGTEIAPVIVKTRHAALGVEVVPGPGSLPAGLKFGGVPEHEGEWQITGTPTTPTPEPVTVELVARSTEQEDAHLSFKWTINPAPPTAETPAKAPETPSKPPETPSKPPETPKITSAGRLGTLPIQKPGKSLAASFLCEVTSCQVQLLATVTVGKSKFKIHSGRTSIAQGQKAKVVLKLSKAQQALVAAALKKHKKVAAALTASIQSSVGFQVTRALTIAVKR
jgi:hypothetical protein